MTRVSASPEVCLNLVESPRVVVDLLSEEVERALQGYEDVTQPRVDLRMTRVEGASRVPRVECLNVLHRLAHVGSPDSAGTSGVVQTLPRAADTLRRFVP